MQADVALARVKAGKERVLLIAYYEPRSVPSIAENIALFQQLSAYPVSVLNLAEHRVNMGYLKIPPALNLDYFDVLLIHNTVAYSPDNLRALDEVHQTKLADYKGVKIVMKQDEHYRFADFVAFAEDAGIDCIFSVMPPGEVAATYGAYLPTVRVHHMLTGYVTPRMRRLEQSSQPRPIDIGYRGSVMPLSFGKLCYQKREIGDEVGRRLDGRGLNLDISSRWEDRIGGDAWFKFLGSCKAVLGVESGTGLFDLDGTLAAHCRSIEERLGPDDGSKAYALSYLDALSHLEGKIKYFAISPRHFEAIAVGAVQILFPGTYTGRMTAGKHYFELKEDYSNLDDAVDLIRDDDRRSRLAHAAYEEVLMNSQNGIETLVGELDAVIAEELDAKGRRRETLFAATGKAKNALLVQAHGFGLDPRRDRWYGSHLPADITIHQLGITQSHLEPVRYKGLKDELIVNVPLKAFAEDCLDGFVGQVAGRAEASFALRELHFIARASKLDDARLLAIYGVPQNKLFLYKFRDNLQYILDTTRTLVEAAAQSRGVQCLVAINFPSLLAAIILKGVLDVPVIYEALEYWPEADPDQGDAIHAFWFELERRIVRFADHRGTVSPSLARIMSEKFGVPFYAVPNCMPMSELPPECIASPAVHTTKGGRVRFLYQGHFAPHRGLEQLITAWPRTDRRAQLILRGPDRPFKNELIELAEKLGLAGSRILFPDAVSVDELIVAARSDGDVGIVPYLGAGTNYEHCSPNKLGQYMAAGLPVLANSTTFVGCIVNGAQCGTVADFANAESLVKAVTLYLDDDFRTRCATNSVEYFRRSFNWEQAAKPFYDALSACLSPAVACEFSLLSGDAASLLATEFEGPPAVILTRAINKLVVALAQSQYLGDSHASKIKLADLLVETGVLDVRDYLDRYRDVEAAGVDAGLHYVYDGAAEGRFPRGLRC